MNYQVNEKGYYGNFGGAFIPEMLFPNVEELKEKYLTIIQSWLSSITFTIIEKITHRPPFNLCDLKFNNESGHAIEMMRKW